MKTLTRIWYTAIVISATVLIAALADAQYIDLKTLPPMTNVSDSPNAVVVDPITRRAYPQPSWLIMVPPIDTGYEVLASAPISRWIQVDIYLDEAGCNRALGNFTGNYIARFLNQSDTLDMQQFSAIQQQTQHAICISKFDPRLTR